MDLKSIRLPQSPFRSTATEARSPVTERVQRGIAGPPMPQPGRNSPAQDIGLLVNGFIGDVQGAGEKISEALDMPFDATVHIQGPHRVVGDFLNSVTGVGRDFIGKITGT